MRYIPAIAFILLCVGRHQLVKERRSASDVLSSVVTPLIAIGGATMTRKMALAAVTAASAAAVAGASDVHPAVEAAPKTEPVVDKAAQFDIEIVPATAGPALLSGQQATVVQAMASRYRIVDRALPPGIAPERGLQVKTILASRAISEDFPQIHDIGGVRPDALRWHPNGLALDVMIPNPSSPEGIALGNEIVQYALANAERFDLQDCIWRGVYYTPNGAQGGRGYGHYDHVHITTHGGGYPTMGETYLR